MFEAQNNDSIIKIRNLNKWYEAFHVLRGIDLDVANGEKIVICGPRDQASPP